MQEFEWHARFGKPLADLLTWKTVWGPGSVPSLLMGTATLTCLAARCGANRQRAMSLFQCKTVWLSDCASYRFLAYQHSAVGCSLFTCRLQTKGDTIIMSITGTTCLEVMSFSQAARMQICLDYFVATCNLQVQMMLVQEFSPVAHMAVLACHMRIAISYRSDREDM